MAVTGFWPTYKNLKATLDYANNPDKTTDRRYLDDNLYAALSYAENDNKTDRKMYVGGINCSKQNVYAEMIAVQRRFGLRGKVVGYHGIQSFREGEVTPKQAFEIGKKTHRDYLREDMEYCLTFATSPREFENQLYALGYTLDPVRFSVKAKHWERSVRLANIGFTKEIVQAQLDKNAESRFHLFTLEYRPPYRPKKFPLEDELRRLEFYIDHSYDAASVLVDTIFYLIITVIQIAAELADVMLLSPDLRATEKDLKELIADYRFMQEHDIHTVADLQANIGESKAQLSDLERERKTLSNRIRRPKSPADENQNKERRKAISKQMKPVRERLRRAEKILEKSPHLYELLKQEHELERKARARYLDRSR